MSALNMKQIMDLSDSEYDLDGCTCCDSQYHNDDYYDDYDWESPDPKLITCPGCGTVAAPFTGFDHFEPECPEWTVLMVSEL